MISHLQHALAAAVDYTTAVAGSPAVSLPQQATGDDGAGTAGKATSADAASHGAAADVGFDGHAVFTFGQPVPLPYRLGPDGQSTFAHETCARLFAVADVTNSVQYDYVYLEREGDQSADHAICMLCDFFTQHPVKPRRWLLHASSDCAALRSEALLHFLLWCVATQYAGIEQIELRFYPAGHVTTAVDAGLGAAKFALQQAELLSLQRVTDVLNSVRGHVARRMSPSQFAAWSRALARLYEPALGTPPAALAVALFRTLTPHCMYYRDEPRGEWKRRVLLRRTATAPARICRRCWSTCPRAVCRRASSGCCTDLCVTSCRTLRLGTSWRPLPVVPCPDSFEQQQTDGRRIASSATATAAAATPTANAARSATH